LGEIVAQRAQPRLPVITNYCRTTDEGDHDDRNEKDCRGHVTTTSKGRTPIANKSK
jgi:hypothetical protein